MSRVKQSWVNLIFFVVTLAINTLGAMGLISGLTQGQISDRYITLITPSPSAFGIWSVIYSLVLISISAMIIKKNDPYYQRAVDQISNLFRTSCVFNMAWIVAFSFVLVEISALFILGFVVTLALICLKLLEIREDKRWLLPATFGLYGGWLFIATVVNAAVALIKLNWSGFGLAQETGGSIMLIVARTTMMKKTKVRPNSTMYCPRSRAPVPKIVRLLLMRKLYVRQVGQFKMKKGTYRCQARSNHPLNSIFSIRSSPSLHGTKTTRRFKATRRSGGPMTSHGAAAIRKR